MCCHDKGGAVKKKEEEEEEMNFIETHDSYKKL